MSYISVNTEIKEITKKFWKVKSEKWNKTRKGRNESISVGR